MFAYQPLVPLRASSSHRPVPTISITTQLPMAAANVSLVTEGSPATGITSAKEPAGLGIDVTGTAPNPALALDTAATELQPPQAHPSNSPLSVIATNSPPLELEPFPQYPPSGVSGWLMRIFAPRSATKEMEDFKRRNTPSVTKGLDAVAASSPCTCVSLQNVGLCY